MDPRRWLKIKNRIWLGVFAVLTAGFVIIAVMVIRSFIRVVLEIN